MGTDAPRLRRHRGLKIFGGFVAAVLVLVLTAAGIGIWTVQRSFPTLDGTLQLPGLHSTVTVHRDSAGIPTIVADNGHDLFMAEGFVHAQDRFWEMDFRRHVTAGRLSELFGKSQVGTDTVIRTLGWRRVAAEEVKMLDKKSLGYYQAYADGVNAYLHTHSGADLSLEYAVLGLQNPGYTPEPWTPVDSVSWLKAMAWDLRSNLPDEVDRALLSKTLSPQQVAELHPGYPYAEHPTITNLPAGGKGSSTVTTDAVPAVAKNVVVDRLGEVKAALERIPRLMGPAGDGIGSNSWVVSGAHTATGKPLLANDPHLGPVMPSVWYQIGLRCAERTPECPFDVSGYSFSGLPGVVIGHNNRVAWGFTNFGADVTDLYLEKIKGDQYEYDGQLKPLKTRTEKIKVAGGKPVTITVRSTEHGPIITSLTKPFHAVGTKHPKTDAVPAGSYQVALEWTALTPGHTAQAIFDLDSAQNWDEFRASAKMFQVPAQNLVYADVDGNIGYQAPGMVPIRKKGDGTIPVPGWTSAYGWSGYVPFDALPSVYNPDKGYIVTANNAAVGPGYPVMVTKDWDDGYRANRITNRLKKLVDSGKKITIEDMEKIQGDTYEPMAAVLVPILKKVTIRGGAADAVKLLTSWDYRDDADSAGAAYFQIFWKNLLHDAFGRKLPKLDQPSGGARWYLVVSHLVENPKSSWWKDDDLGVDGRDEMFAKAAGDAYRETVRLMGDDMSSWQWGKIHTLELTNASFGESGIAPIEWLFNRGPYELAGSASVVDANGWTASAGYEVTHVPSMRQVVSLADFDESRWINLTGESGHAFHPNYDDQAPLWQKNETRPWPFSGAAVKRAAVDTLTLDPGGP